MSESPRSARPRQAPRGSDRGGGELARVAESLAARSAELAERQAATLRATLPSYQAPHNLVPDDALLPSAERNVGRAVKSLLDGRPPAPEQVDEAWVARERTQQGLPVGEMLDAYRMAHRVIRDEFLAAAAEQRASIDPDAVIVAACVLWETADAGASQLFAVRRQMELELAGCDEAQRTEFLQALLRGSLTAHTTKERAASYGLRLDRPYLAIRARALGTVPAEALRRTLEAGSRLHDVGAFLAVVDDEVVGLVPRRPEIGRLAAVVGLSYPADVQAANESFRAASRMLEVASRFNATGVFDLTDLGMRVAIASEPELGRALSARYLAPLAAEGSSVRSSRRRSARTSRSAARCPRRRGRCGSIPTRCVTGCSGSRRSSGRAWTIPRR